MVGTIFKLEVKMKFVIYGKSGCSGCEQTKSLLIAKGIPFDYKQSGVDYSAKEFQSFNPTHRTFPLITECVGDKEVYLGTLDDLKNKLK